MFGAHLSVAGGLVNALIEAQRLRMDCVQVFTRNQRQWSPGPLSAEDRDAWAVKLKEMGWHRQRSAPRTVSHSSYLINLASPDRALRRRSIAAQRRELNRCEALSIRRCVLHPGAHMGRAVPAGAPRPPGSAMTADERAGLRRVVSALDRLHRDLPGLRVVTCLETTAGAGTTLGCDFHQLAYIRQRVREPGRIGFCLDTCHVTAAGYDMSTPAGARAVLRQFDEICGRRNLLVLHLNDSVGKMGSRLDRHTHIGHGECGLSCFAALVNNRSLARVPKILETPKGIDQKGIPWDVVNMRRLKRLMRRRAGSR